MAPPKPGDKIYFPTSLHISHGVDDFQGGLCTVVATRTEKRPAGEVTYVESEKDPDRWTLWETYLEPQQERLKQHFGEQKGAPNPDFRKEFNRWEE
jgi:hypothetical protein